MPAPDRLTWWSPYRETVRLTIDELRAIGLLRLSLLVRPTLAVALLTAAGIAWMLHAYPGAAVPWRAVVATVLYWPTMYAATAATLVFMPVQVSVDREFVWWLRNSPRRIDRRHIEQVSLVPNVPPVVPRLVISYRDARGRPQSKTLLVAPRVDLAELAAVTSDLAGAAASRLAVPPDLRDPGGVHARCQGPAAQGRSPW